jgi:HEAT repeat protein
MSLAEDPNEEVRAEAIHALGKMRHVGAQKLLMIRLRDAYWKVRAEAAVALAQLKDPSATKQLFRVVDDPDDYARTHITDALLNLADPSQAEVYLRCLESDNVFRKAAAALALAKINRAEAIPVLTELLKDHKAPNRLKIAQALAAAKALDPQSAAALFQRERNSQVKEVLRRIL